MGRGWTIAGIQKARKQPGAILIKEGDGSATYFRFNPLTGKYQAPDGDFSRLDSIPGGTVTWVRSYPDSTKVTFNAAGEMVRIRDRLGVRDTVLYSGGKVSQVRDHLNNSISFAYGANGLSSITDPMSRVTTVTVQANKTLTSIQDPGGGSTQFAYDGSLRLRRRTDRKGNIFSYAYDLQSGKVVADSAPSIPVFSVGNVVPVTLFSPWQKRGIPYVPTSSGSGAVPLAPDTAYASITEPGGAVTRFTVNPWGSPVQTLHPLSDTTRVAYTVHGQPTIVRLPSYTGTNADTTFYNASGLVTYDRKHGSTGTTILYGGWGQPLDISGPNQPTIQFNIGAFGSITRVRRGGVYGDSLTYDSYGRVLVRRDGKNTVMVRNTYYPTGATRNLDTTASPLGVTKHTYDTYGRPITIAAPLAAVRHLFYDGLNRLTRDSIATSPTATVTRFAYDSLYQVRVTDPKSQVYAFGYNALGWLIADTVPAGRARSYQYSRDGDLMRLINRRGQNVDFTYDAQHRLTRRTAGGNFVSWTYPIADHGRRVIDSSAHVINTTRYNARGTPDSVITKFIVPNQTHTTAYSYNSAGLLATVTFASPASPALVTRSYGYNTSQGVLTSIKLGSDSTKLAFDANLRDTSVTFPGGNRERHVQGGLQANIQDSTAAAYNADIMRFVGYDAAGRISQNIWQSQSNQLKSRFYSYDPLSRLQQGENKTSAMPLPGSCYQFLSGYASCPGIWTPAPGESNTYAFDAVGNRTDLGASYMTGTNRMTGFAGWSYQTDLDGNVTNRDSTGVATTFTWNPQGQLTGTTRTGQPSVTYHYDANGRLVRKDLNGSASSYFLWQGEDLLAEFNSDGTTKVAEYSYYGTDRLHALIQKNGAANQSFYAHDDALGNVIALTNEAGSSTARTYQYADWGRLSGGTNWSLPQTDKDRARWKGALWMGSEAGDLYFMRNRWYEPAAGRFLSEDPIGLEGGINPMTYGGNDVVNRRDPFGNCSTWLQYYNTEYPSGEETILYEVCLDAIGGGAGEGKSVRDLPKCIGAGVLLGLSIVPGVTTAKGVVTAFTGARRGFSGMLSQLHRFQGKGALGTEAAVNSWKSSALAPWGKEADLQFHSMLGSQGIAAVTGNLDGFIDMAMGFLPVFGTMKAAADFAQACIKQRPSGG